MAIYTVLLLVIISNSASAADRNEINGPIIGIDLGTTYSCVGIYKNGHVEIIPNDQGNRITPSYVAYNDEGRIIGDAAKNQLTSNPKNTIYDAKRVIGRKFSEKAVQETLKTVSYEIINNKDKPEFRIQNSGKLQNFTPEEISAMVLSKMKQIAEEYLGEKVEHAVVTVPAYFNDAQRSATKDAGIIAGLKIERVLNEPTAAALAYGLDKKVSDKGEQNVLIFDLGGGTFDVSLLAIENGVFEVLSTSGNTHLGGEDFDHRIVDYFAKLYKKKTGQDIRSDKRAMQKLRREAEMAKRKLSAAHQVKLEIEDFYKGEDFSESLTRAKFEELNADLFKKCMEPLNEVLKSADIDKTEIDEIVLVGGSTRIPKIQKMVENYFNKAPSTGVNPDEAVAYGAAIQACVISGKCDNFDNEVVILDVCPLSLGIETVGGVMTKVLAKDTTIPAKKVQIFSTASDNQDRVTISVAEGERAMIKDNHFLGKFDLTGIAPAPRGQPQIEVTFELDVNGILKVSAKDKGSSNEESIKIDQNEGGGLSKEEMERMIKEAEDFNEQDTKMREQIEARNSLEGYAHGIKHQLKHELKEKLNVNALERVETAVNDVIEWVDANQSADAQDFKDKQVDLENTIKSLTQDEADQHNEL